MLARRMRYLERSPSPVALAESQLMSEADVCQFLGTDSKGIRKLIHRGSLRRDDLTGAFLRAQVREVHDSIVRSFHAPATETGEYRSAPILS